MKDTARRILAAAIPCFAAKGQRATTRDVAKAAGVNVATLAYHFGGKAGLYRAAIASLYERFLAVDPAALQLEGPPREQLERLVRLLYQLARAHQDEVRLLLRHVLEQGGLPEQARAQGVTDAFLTRAHALLEGLGVSLPADWRLRLLSINYLLARYAVSPAEDLRPYLVPGEDPERAVEDHVAHLASALLLGPPAS